MKKTTVRICLALLLSLMACTTAAADSQKGKTQPDIITDYYMIVESKAGGIDMYSNPDFSSAKLNEELIPNGTALHIEGEVENDRTWGYAEYHGMMGFAPLDDCRPAQSRQEAIDSELYIAGRDNVNYNADYDVKAYSGQGTQKLYQGPGEKYGTVPRLREIENGETLHITQDAELVDGSRWGKTSVDGKSGWINLEDTEEAAEVKEEALQSKEKAEVSPTEEAAEVREEAHQPEKKAEVLPTEEAAEVKEETPQPEKKAEASPTEEIVTAEPSDSAEATPTEKEETDSSQHDRADLEEEKPEAQKASSSDVEASSGIPRSFIWIALAAVLAASGVLIYHFKKR